MACRFFCLSRLLVSPCVCQCRTPQALVLFITSVNFVNHLAALSERLCLFFTLHDMQHVLLEKLDRESRNDDGKDELTRRESIGRVWRKHSISKAMVQHDRAWPPRG